MNEGLNNKTREVKKSENGQETKEMSPVEILKYMEEVGRSLTKYASQVQAMIEETKGKSVPIDIDLNKFSPTGEDGSMLAKIKAELFGMSGELDSLKKGNEHKNAIEDAKKLNKEAEEIYKNTINETSNIKFTSFYSMAEEIDPIFRKLKTFDEGYDNKFYNLRLREEEDTKDIIEAHESMTKKHKRLREIVGALSSQPLDASRKRENEICWNNIKILKEEII